MLDNEFYAYDQLMIGNKETIVKQIFGQGPTNKKVITKSDEERVLKLLRYAFEYYLEWTPEQVRANMDEAVLKKLHLDSLVSQRLEYPDELAPMENLEYVCCRMYPHLFHYNRERAVEGYYEKVLRQDISRVRKSFFTGEGGSERLSICLRYVINRACSFTSKREMYEFFAGKGGRVLLNKYKLLRSCAQFYKDPLEFLHYSLNETDRSQLEYERIRFSQALERPVSDFIQAEG